MLKQDYFRSQDHSFEKIDNLFPAPFASHFRKLKNQIGARLSGYTNPNGGTEKIRIVNPNLYNFISELFQIEISEYIHKIIASIIRIFIVIL